MKTNKLFKGYIYVILSALIFGLMPLMAKFIYKDGVNPQSLVFLRSTISLPFLFILSLITKGSVKIKKEAIPHISFIAIMGCCVTPFLLFSSYNHISSGTATVFHFIYPGVVVLGEYIFLKSRLSKKHILSVILCITGILMFYNKSSDLTFVGSILALTSGVTYAIYVICLSGFKYKEISGFTFCFYIALVSSIVMLLLCITTNQLTFPVSLRGWIITILFSFSVNVGAVLLFQKGTFIIGGSKASVLSTLEPATSILTGVIVFSEKISLLTVIGTILVILASVLIAIGDAEKKK